MTTSGRTIDCSNCLHAGSSGASGRDSLLKRFRRAGPDPRGVGVDQRSTAMGLRLSRLQWLAHRGSGAARPHGISGSTSVSAACPRVKATGARGVLERAKEDFEQTFQARIPLTAPPHFTTDIINPTVNSNYSNSVVPSTFSTHARESFAGLFTRVETGQASISLAGYGLNTSVSESGSTSSGASQRE